MSKLEEFVLVKFSKRSDGKWFRVLITCGYLACQKAMHVFVKTELIAGLLLRLVHYLLNFPSISAYFLKLKQVAYPQGSVRVAIFQRASKNPQFFLLTIAVIICKTAI